jgi:hypothetical protein
MRTSDRLMLGRYRVCVDECLGISGGVERTSPPSLSSRYQKAIAIKSLALPIFREPNLLTVSLIEWKYVLLIFIPRSVATDSA